MDTRRYANLGAKPLKYLKVSCTYDVKTTGSTKICYNTSGLVSMKVDGISTSKTTGYTFDSLGEHFVDFYLSGTTVPNVIFSGCTDMQYVEFEDGITSIGSYAFNGCNGLQCEIVIPDSVTSIGSNAFNACYGITSLVLGENLINIGNYAFNGCNKITGDLVIPNSVTTIGEYAFRYVYRIKTLILGENITSIGRYAFADCYYMENINFPNKLKTIANYAFSFCTYITKVNIPDSVKSIGSSAFSYCSRLTSVEIGSGCTSIGYEAFKGCSSLTSVVIPDSVTSIGNYAFQNCSGLTSVEIGSGCTSIGEYAFQNCSGLTSVEIGSGCTSIGDYAFENCSGLTSVEIPDSVTSMGNYAFYYCSELTSVEIGNGCTSIGKEAFHGCNRLTSVEIGNGCTSIGEKAFYYCNKLTSVEIGSGCTSIGKQAFYYCQSLNKITCHAITAPTLSSDVFTYIGRYGTLIYPEGSDYSNWLQNSSNSYLGYYNWNEEYPVIIAKYDIISTTYSEQLINQTISVIQMFIDDIEVNVTKEFIFSTTGIHTVKYIVNQSYTVESLFSNCTRLLDISVGEGVRSIGRYSFNSCKKLKNVKLPSTLTTINSYAFSNCVSLEKIELPASLSSIDGAAFNGCSSLREIICHSATAPSITNQTFNNIHSYGTLNYPEGSDYSNWLQNSSYYLGYYGWNTDEKGDLLKVTYNVTDISTPSTLLYESIVSNRTYFGPTMYVDGVAKPISNTYLFDSVGTHIVEYVLNTTSFSSLGQYSYVFPYSSTPIIAIEIPAKLVSIQSLLDHNTLTNIIVNQNNTTLDSRDNCNCVIKTATNTIILGSSNSIIPDSVTSIGNNAFSGCTNLTGELVIPDSMTSIGEKAFYQCSGLTGELVIPDSVTSIGSQAFYQCSGLASVEIGDGCTSIGNQAFQDCSGLTSVEIGSGVTSIGNQAFYNCSNLNRITCRAITAPSINNTTFSNVSPYGVLNYPEGSDYSSWLQNSSYYLGYYNWNKGNPNALIIRGYMTLSNPSVRYIIYNTSEVENVYVNGRRWLHGQNSASFEAGSYTIEYVLKGTVIPKNMFQSTAIDELIIPEGITEIQSYAFQSSSLKRTSIPSGITFGDSIFQDAYQLTDITFEEGTTFIPRYTFYRCENLKNVNLPNSLTTMNGCFYKCDKLEKLTVPVSVTEAYPIHTSCQNLKEIYFYPQIAPNYTTDDQCAPNIKHYIPYGADYSSFFNSIYQRTYRYTFDTLNGEDEELNNVTLDGYDLAVVMKVFGPHETLLFNGGGVVEMSIDGVKLDAPVNTYAFSNSGFGKKHVIRYKLSQTVIHSHMFGLESSSNGIKYYSLPISEIIIGDRITGIFDDAFRNCRDLKKITIGSGLTSINTSYNNSNTLRESTFLNCFQLESININPLNPIFDSRDNCNCIIETATNTILLGSNNSFIPDSVEKIHDRAFYYCSGLTGELVIPDSVTSIGTYAFAGCWGLTSVEIGSGCTSIGQTAFSGCLGLTSVEIGSGVTSIGNYAFQNCSGLTGELVIPDSVTSIGPYAFSYCSGLTSVEIGSGVTSMGEWAFAQCYGLTSVEIGSGVTGISECAFYYCSGLTGELVIPDSVTSIGNSAFQHCTGLTSVEIGSGVTSIGNQAFYGCNGLNEITCYAINAPSLANNVFSSMKYYGTLNYPEGSDYSSWLQNSSGYLGYLNWNMPILKINITRNATAEQLNQGDSRYKSFYKGSIVGLEIDGIPQNQISTSSSLPGEHVFTVFVKEPIIPADAYDSYIYSFITFLETNFEPVSIGKNNYFKYFKNGFKLGDYVSTSDRWTIPPSLTSLDGDFFSDQCTTIISYATTAPQIKNTNVFSRNVYFGTLIYPEGSDYSSWLQNSSGYLGYYGWNEETPRYKMTFNITDISAPTVLFEGNGSTEIATAYFQKMYIDGIEYPVSQSHLFTSLGEHVVEFMMKRNTLPSLANCPNLIKLELPSHPSFTALTRTLVYSSGTSLNSITIGYYYTQLNSSLANSPSKIKEIISLAPIAPTITSSTFNSGVDYYGTLIYPEGSDYSSWLQNSRGYLGYYGWNEEAPVLTAIYDVATTGDTELCKSTSYIQEMYIDEVKVTPTKYYRFATLGKHTVKYIFNTNFYIPSNVFHLGYNSGGLIRITELDISSKFTAISDGAFRDLSVLKKITCHATVAPTIGQNTFNYVSPYGTLIYPEGSDYSSWLNTNGYYLGYYHWNTPGIPFKVTYNVSDNQMPVKICNRPSEFISLTINGKEVPLATTYLFDDVGEYTAEYRLKNNTIPASAFTACYSLKQVEFNNDIEIIDNYAFSNCIGIEGLLKFPESIKTINQNAFAVCRAIKEIQIDGSPTIGNFAFSTCTGLQKITCLSHIAPTITSLTFQGILYYGDLYYYPGTGYETWLSTNSYYLGYYQWNNYQTYKPLTYYNLTITAEDVSARATNTIITWSYMTDGINPVTNEPMTGIQYTGTTVSESFDQNLSETETVERVITFEYMGMTASTTIIQGVWVNQNYTVDLNSQWQLSTSIANPDSGTYEGVYESFSNKGVNSSAAIMYIDIVGYDTFQLYIRSNGESCCDYVVVSNLDCALSSGTTSGANVKMTTQSKPQSGTAIGNYTLVEFTGIDGGEHRITVMYRKDGSAASGTDQGYVLIPKNQ